MSGFSRRVHGRNVHLPNLFTSEVRELNLIFDEYEAEITKATNLNQDLCAQLSKRNDEIRRLKDLLQADLLAKELKEKLVEGEAQPVKRGRFWGLL